MKVMLVAILLSLLFMSGCRKPDSITPSIEILYSLNFGQHTYIPTVKSTWEF